MRRHDLIQLVLRKVAKKVLNNKNNLAFYKSDKGFTAQSDILAHKTFLKEIAFYFPEDTIFSEEDNENTKKQDRKSKFSWIVDPICGTTNYLYDIPFYSHSLTLLKNNKPYAAGVFDPLRDELFFSYDKKFYLNNKIKYSNKVIPMQEALISINTNQSNFDNEQYSLKKIVTKLGPPVCRRIKIIESANLELSYLACGRIDAYYNPTDKPWDIAAAQVLVPSAGGFVHILNNPNENILNQRGILAASSRNLLDEILMEIKQ